MAHAISEASHQTVRMRRLVLSPRWLHKSLYVLSCTGSKINSRVSNTIPQLTVNKS